MIGTMETVWTGEIALEFMWSMSHVHGILHFLVSNFLKYIIEDFERIYYFF